MRKKLLSLALALVMCLGLAVPAMAEGSTETPLDFSATISQEEVMYLQEGIADPYAVTMYTVDPGTVISLPIEGYWGMSPCVNTDGVFNTPYAFRNEGVNGENSRYITILPEQAGYWHVQAEAPGYYLEDYVIHVTGEAPVLSFSDVASDAYCADSVMWAAFNRITEGTGGGNFSPDQTCTNAQILTFIWRAEGKPEPTIADPFTNSVPDTYAKAAIWAYEKGLVSGTTFEADEPCTRAMAMTYLWQVAGCPEYNTIQPAGFSDVSASAPYAKAVDWAVNFWVAFGTSETTFSPDQTCTRGQIVTFLDRYKNMQ